MTLGTSVVSAGFSQEVLEALAVNSVREALVILRVAWTLRIITGIYPIETLKV